MATCTYTLNDKDGKEITLTGLPELKAYLATGGLQHLLPARAAELPVTDLARFSINDEQAPTDSLAIIHNLSLDNLIHADKMGGIAAPSVAVVNKNHPLDSFGEISLVGHKDTLGPQASNKNRYFNADIYSPRYPTVKAVVDYGAFKKFTESLSEKAKKLNTQVGRLSQSDIEEKGLIRGLEYDLVMQYEYLQSINKAPAFAYRPKTILPKAYQPFLEKASASYFSREEDFRRAAVNEYNNRHEDYPITDFNSSEAYNIARNEGELVNKAYNEEKNGKSIDTAALDKLVRKRMSGKETQYKEWLAENYSDLVKKEQIFDGFTNSGNRRYLEHNLDNVVKILTRQVKGGEGFNYGVPSIRAQAAKQFKTIKAIQDERGALVSKEQMETLKNEVNTEFKEISEELSPYAIYQDSYDNSSSALAGMASKGYREFNEYYKNVPQETLQKVVDFLNKLKHMPSEYFEGKIGRAVSIGEFEGAVVPTGKAYESAVAILKKHGVTNIKRYNPNDTESRSKALQSFSSLMFSIPGQQQPPAVAAQDKTFAEALVNRLRNISGLLGNIGHALLTVRQLVEQSPYLPYAERYVTAMEQYRETIDGWLQRGGRVLDVWRTLDAPQRKEASSVMNLSTEKDIDASRDWAAVVKTEEPSTKATEYRIYTQATFTPERRGALLKAARQISGIALPDSTNVSDVLMPTQSQAQDYLGVLNAAQAEQTAVREGIHPDENPGRQARHKLLQARFNALPDAAKHVYAETHKLHNEMDAEQLQVLIDRTTENIVNTSKREALIAAIRMQFEASGLKFYYAPLQRFGEHWFYGFDKNGRETHVQRESTQARDEAEAEFVKEGGTVKNAGTSIADMQAIKSLGGSDSFITDVMSIIDSAGLDKKKSDALKDNLYQMYLSRMPAVSMRHSSQHRKGTAGYEEDAMRSYAYVMQHSASQLANMREGAQMERVLEELREIQTTAQHEEKRLDEQAQVDAAKLLKSDIEELSVPGALDALIDDALEADDTVSRIRAAITLRKTYKNKATLDSPHTAALLARSSALNRQAYALLKDNWGTLGEVGVLETKEKEAGKAAPMVREWRAAKKLLNTLSDDNGIVSPITLDTLITKLETRLANARLLSNPGPRITSEGKQISEYEHGKELRNKAAQDIEELTKAFQATMNPDIGEAAKVAGYLRQLSYIYLLGFGVSSAAVNSAQTPVIAMPMVWSRYGVPATVKAFKEAYGLFAIAVKAGMPNRPAGARLLDAEGHASITTVLEQRLENLVPGTAAHERLKGALQMLNARKLDGGVGRTQTYDIIGVGKEGEEYGGPLLEFSKLAGWMFHHIERMNREVTFYASYMAAHDNITLDKKQGETPLGHDNAAAYSKKLTLDAHLDTSPENKARIFRGWPAGLALQFKSYQIGMFYQWAKFFRAWRNGYKLMPEATVEQRAAKHEAELRSNEARRALSGMFIMQGAVAGMYGLPMAGTVAAALNFLANLVDPDDDDDKPWDVMKEGRVWLTELAGETIATAITKGGINAFTSMNAASRMDLANIFFRDNISDLEGRDQMTSWMASLLGPTGGIAQKAWGGFKLIGDGEYERGLEQILPKAPGDVLKAGRYATEGARSINGTQLKEMSLPEIFQQAFGLGSSNLEVRQTFRGYEQDEKTALDDARMKIIHEIANARINGEQPDLDSVYDWNRKHPGIPIRGDNIRASMRSTLRNRALAGEKGWYVSPKYKVEEQENP